VYAAGRGSRSMSCSTPEEITSKTVGDLAGIDLVVLPLRCGNGPQHQGMGNLHLFGMRKQVIVDPAGEDRRFHGYHPGLGKSFDPGIKLAPRRSDLAFLMDPAGCVLHAIADRLLRNSSMIRSCDRRELKS
jgi:hypothetical protein